MSKVHVLPESIISKIAAGEVIDRPSAVIKELLENSLDAGATEIEIQIEDAGKKLIRIQDNGSGIDAEDLDKIFIRHSTSKIQSVDDLFSINTLGFRGEALYSIASIADIIVETKTKDNDSGWMIHCHGGEQDPVKPTALNQSGTDIQVRELFFNTPARRKFLKTNTTEFYHILHTVIPYALLHPTVQFKLTHNQKSILDLSPTEDPRKRMSQTLNFEANQFILGEFKDDQESISCSVILSDQNIRRNRRDYQFLFINDRPVHHKSLLYHLNQMYRVILPPDNFGVFLINLSIPEADVDVNIHPTKREVKLHRDQRIIQIIKQYCENLLIEQSSVPTVDYSAPTDSGYSSKPMYPTFNQRQDLQMDRDFSAPTEIREQNFTSYATPTSQPQFFSQESQPSFVVPEQSSPDSLTSLLNRARYIGSFIDKFQLFEAGDQLLIMDHHAAAERVNYEKFLLQIKRNQVEEQPLLAPVVIDVSPSEMLIWEELKDEMAKVGFQSHQFNPTSIAISSHPTLISNIETSVKNLLAGENLSETDHDQIAKRACKASVRAGDHLNKESIQGLVDQLLGCVDPLTCPHGRPTVIQLSDNFLSKQFLRI